MVALKSVCNLSTDSTYCYFAARFVCPMSDTDVAKVLITVTFNFATEGLYCRNID